MRPARRARVASALAIPLALASPARALFHFAHISEVMTSYAGDTNVQFVEIEMTSGAQGSVANSVLAAFDASGSYVRDVLVVPGNLTNQAAGDRWIMGTTAFETASGLQVDFEFDPAIGLLSASGMLCWGAPGLLPPPDPASWDHSDPTMYVDCLAYGAFSSPGYPNPTPLSPDGHSLRRTGDTGSDAADFACADPADPESNTAGPVSLVATEPCPLPPAPQSKAQQKCIQALNKAAAGVAKAQGKLARSCVAAFAKGRAPSASGCLADDAAGKVDRAIAKTIAANAKSCDPEELPDFGYTGTNVSVDAARASQLDLLELAFGDALDSILALAATDPDGARCQAEVQKGAAAVVDAALRAALKAKKAALRGEPPAAGAGELAGALAAALAADAKLARARDRLGEGAAETCMDAPLATLFDPTCLDTTVGGYGACVAARAVQSACLALAAMDALPIDCDAVDDGAEDGSYPAP